VKNKDSATNVWKKVISIHANKGSLYKTNLLTQLQTLRLVESGDMREHFMKMSEIKEQLAKINCPVTDEFFVSYICISLSLVLNYRTLLTILNATVHKSGRKLTSSNLIWHLTKEANSITLENSINKSNATMMAAMSRSKDSRGKPKSKEKPKAHCSNPNCNKDSHTTNQCPTKGGGKEKEAPEWFKKLAARKTASASVHIAKNIKNDDADNFVMLTYSLPDDPTALVVTSNFTVKAHTASETAGIILDSGASRHFSPDHLKLTNYKEISPEPIRATDGHTFSALGKGDLKLKLPNGDQKPTPIMLRNVYYSPQMAFTLMSVSCVDQARFSLFIKNRACAICSSKSNIIGCIPLVWGLYQVSGMFNQSSIPSANSASKLMSISELHYKMGHVNHDNLHKMVKQRMVTGLDVDLDSKPEFCKACVKAKADWKLFPKKSEMVYTKYGKKVIANL
jgi:hypothetical protein